jgi:hypothetical protein
LFSYFIGDWFASDRPPGKTDSSAAHLIARPLIWREFVKQRLKLFIQSLIGSFTKRINGPHVYALIAKTGNGLFAVDPEDFEVGRRLRMSGKYGIDEIERLKPHITSCSRVLIVGAHIGTMAIPHI